MKKQMQKKQRNEFHGNVGQVFINVGNSTLTNDGIYQEDNDNNRSINKKKTNEKSEAVGKKKKGPGPWTKLLLPIGATIFVAILSAVLPRILDYKNQKGNEETFQTENINQQFENEEKLCEFAQLDYIECTITSNPVMSGYQVRVYPYLRFLVDGEWEYLPIIGLYTQDQYSADADGICTLIREDITKQIQQYIEDATEMTIGYDYDIATLVVVDYVSDSNKDTREVYELRIGKLTVPDDEIIVKVLAAYENKKRVINVIAWPDGKEKVIKFLK